VKAREEEGNEAESVRESPELERRRRGRATTKEGSSGEIRDVRALEQGRQL
jgi:hypothetical protein